MDRLGHGAVIVFFVLSGYVIANSTLSKPSSVKIYCIARLSRLYSVVLPALLLTAILQAVGTAVAPEMYLQLGRGFDLFRYALVSVFLQNIWCLSASPGSNNPFWSLGYEFWYYVLFGVFVLARSGWRKLILLIAVTIVAGPNILLLLPCWLLGVVLYFANGRALIRGRAALIGSILSLGAMICVITFMKHEPHSVGHKPLLWSGAFLSDWTKAAFVFLSIFFFDQAFGSVQVAPGLHRAIRFCSDHTFSLYLYHYPIIVFLTATNLVNANSSWWVLTVAGIGVLSLIFELSKFTEAKRGKLRRFFDQIWYHSNLNRVETNPQTPALNPIQK